MIEEWRLFLGTWKRYFQKEKVSILVGFIAALIFSAISIATPYLTRFLIDEVFIAKRTEMMLPFLMFSVAVLLVMTAAGISADFILVKAFQRVNLNMRMDLYSVIQKAPVEFISTQRSGELSYRLFEDTECIGDYFAKSLINIPVDLVFILVVSSIMVSWNWQLSLFAFSVLAIQMILMIKFRQPLLTLSMKRKIQGLAGNVVEQFRNIQIVRSLNAEVKEWDKFRKGLNELMKVNVSSFMLGKVVGLLINLINNLWSFAILWYGGNLVIQEVVSIGTLMAFLLISGMLFPRISSICNTFLAFQDVRVSINRFNEYESVAPSVDETENAPDLAVSVGSVVMTDVNFGYKIGRPVLNSVNVSFAPYSITAVIGKSGSGKSTIAKILVRFYDPWEGSVSIDGYCQNGTQKSLFLWGRTISQKGPYD